MLVTFPCDGAKTNMIMNFVFWNVRGLADKTKRRMVRDICRECSVDIFCLEESKLNNPSANIISSLFGRFSFDMDIKDSCGAWVGIIVGMRMTVLVTVIVRTDRFSVLVTVCHLSDRWTQIITVVYVLTGKKLGRNSVRKYI